MAAILPQVGQFYFGAVGQYYFGVNSFIQTCLREWAYGRLWHTSAERTSWLPAFLDYYNNRRAHSALGYRPPASRLGGNNLLTINT